jgi:hypothetical protein
MYLRPETIQLLRDTKILTAHEPGYRKYTHELSRESPITIFLFLLIWESRPRDLQHTDASDAWFLDSDIDKAVISLATHCYYLVPVDAIYFIVKLRAFNVSCCQQTDRCRSFLIVCHKTLSPHVHAPLTTPWLRQACLFSRLVGHYTN